MANSRYYSSIAQQTTLTSGITSSGTSMIVAATTGFPGSLPYTLAVDYGTATEELVTVTAVAGTTLTVIRAVDGTSGSAHNPGAVVRHVSSARDFTDSRTHEASASGVHGITGSVVGTSDTQTLTNKTVTHVLGSADNFKLYNKGATGVTQIIGDSTNPSPNRLEVLDNESALNTLLIVQFTGNIKSIKASGEADNIYRLRLTDNDGITDRFALLSGGTLSIAPTSSTTFVGLNIAAPDLSTTKRAIRVAASNGSSERFTVWNDGRVDIVGSDGASSQLDVTAAASQSADVFRVLDSSSGTSFSVLSTGRMNANKGGIVAMPGITSGAVLQVGGSNLGYVGNLTQWVDPSNSVVATVNQDGHFTAPGFSTLPVTTTSAAITASTGWTITSQFGYKAAGMITIIANVQRSGAAISFDSGGDITDTDWFTVNAGWIPNAFFTSSALLPVPSTNGGLVILGRMTASSGLVQVVAGTPSGTINTGSNCRIHLTYHA